MFVNAGFTRRIVGVPKAESDHVLRFLHEQFAVNHDFAWRVKWEKDDVAIWDVSSSSRGTGITFADYRCFRFCRTEP